MPFEYDDQPRAGAPLSERAASARLGAGIAASLAVLALTGCGGGSSTSSSPGAPASSSPASAGSASLPPGSASASPPGSASGSGSPSGSASASPSGSASTTTRQLADVQAVVLGGAGRELTVQPDPASVEGGCGTTFTASVRETAERVVLRLTATPSSAEVAACVLRPTVVRLDQPLGKRQLVDAYDEETLRVMSPG